MLCCLFVFDILSFPRVFSLSAKDDVDWVDVTSCVESAVVGESVCICDESEGFVLGYITFLNLLFQYNDNVNINTRE